jgi:glutamate synthase (NADPH) small chain
MADSTGFLKHGRALPQRRPVDVRIRDWKEVYEEFPAEHLHDQAARCMDCGIPFCHNGCPLGNLVPEWNDLVWKDDWTEATERLHATNNFPEFTGRLCPAPCEAACVLGINDDPVTIKQVEVEIADRAWDDGRVVPQPPGQRTGKRVAVVGSGPAGLAAAQQLTRAGHEVVVLERADRIGGLLRYGIPDFKMDKTLIDRRVAQMEVEGVIFRTGMEVGTTVPVERLMDDYHVLVLAGGAERPRDLPVPGRDLSGVQFAMDYLTQANRRVANLPHAGEPILATGRHVVVIGGGDTGSDCIGTANRQGAASVTQLEIMPEPPGREDKALTWPHWPVKLRTSSSQEEGCDRLFSAATIRLLGEEGRVAALEYEQAGERRRVPAELVLLAMGFTGPAAGGIAEQSGVALTPRGDVAAQFGRYATSRERIFACGDMRRGQSLVVWAIREGRDCAEAVHAALIAAEARLPR